MSTVIPDAAPAAELRRVDQLLAHYGQSHQNPRNAAIHCVAFPLIMFSLVGLLYAAHPWAAWSFVAASLVYYARLSLVSLGIMVGVSAVVLLLVQSMGTLVLPLSLAIFVVVLGKLFPKLHW